MKRQISKWENSFDSRKTLTLQADQSLVWVSARRPTNVPPKQSSWSKRGVFPHRGCLKCQQESRAGAAVPPRLAVPSRRGGCLTKALPFTHQPWLVYVFRPSRLQPDLCRSWNGRWAGERLFSRPTRQAMLLCAGMQLQTAVSSRETTLARFPPPKELQAASEMHQLPQRLVHARRRSAAGARGRVHLSSSLPCPGDTDARLQPPAAWPQCWWFCTVLPSPFTSRIQCFENFCVTKCYCSSVKSEGNRFQWFP